MEQLPNTQTRNSTLKAVFEVENAEKALAELAHIMLNLRHSTRLFDRHFGYHNRVKKRTWEAQADRWLAKHKIEEQECQD